MTLFASRALYRSRQVLHALRPRVDEDGLQYVRGFLPEPLSRLFFAMERRDQRHALEVTGRLRAMAVQDRDLLTAALLHDCGKGAVPVWLRIAYVLAPTLVPALVRRAGVQGAMAGWRGAAQRLANHVTLGERLASDAGASEVTLRLIAGRPAQAEERLLALLMQADDAS